MKVYIICLFLLSCCLTEQVSLINGAHIALESGVLDNFYITASGRDCMNINEGKCGSVYGLHVPRMVNVTTIDYNTLLTPHTNLLWTLVGTQDFFCLQNLQFNSFLSIEGTSCLNLTGDRQCGRLYLHKLNNMICTQQYGWRIRFIQNYYVLESVQFPGVYLYFNLNACSGLQNSRVLRRCGTVFVHSFRNITNISITNNIYRWIFFNIHPIITTARIPMVGRNITHV